MRYILLIYTTLSLLIAHGQNAIQATIQADFVPDLATEMTLNSQEIKLKQDKAFKVWKLKLNGEHQNANSLLIRLVLDGNEEVVQLVRNYPVAPNALIKSASGKSFPINAEFYSGTIKGVEKSLVSISFFEGKMQGLIVKGDEVYALGNHPQHGLVLVEESGIKKERENFCSVSSDLKLNNPLANKSPRKSHGNCVQVYFELDYDMFQNKGSIEAASNYLLGAFNEIHTLYKNENLQVQVSEIFVWDLPSPYLGSSSLSQLQQFQALRPVYNGDIAHLVDLKDNLGGVAYVDVLCTNSAYAYSGIESDYKSFPTYSWTIEVITHEIGHNLGSPHTHDCSWPGGAIDGCYPSQGSCEDGPQPENGGTIMSYCHLTSNGINFNNGFGPLPGDLIRSRVANATCLSGCGHLCVAPNKATQTGVGSNSARLTWNEVEGVTSYDYDYRLKGQVKWTSATTNSVEVNLSNLVENRIYEFRVRSLCSETNSVFSGVSEFTTGEIPSGYCESYGSNASSEWIEGVSFNNFQNVSGSDGGYGDFTSEIIPLLRTADIAFELVPGFDGGILGPNTYPEYWRIWIDLNRNGSFYDEDELVYNAGKTSEEAVEGTFAIPAWVENGVTRMRVSMKFNASQGPCENFGEGEVEDYHVNITNTVGIGEEELDQLSLYPNPTKARIWIIGVKEPSSYKVFDNTGKLVLDGLLDADQDMLDVQSLEKGLYHLIVNGKKPLKFIVN
ncbi:GEVED domain-containing protein [Luteibaculum oceani]|uniref:T9SS type A sorting domain-containing protein n=1 Tax=Luteibaculum oceani TaxID=1294296 RepID=A0A5C6UTL7_9FLAO|nr:GEVED domain-containing protein [Luteibaculum oceani]TXC75581.1 T9SS type A sorting domain-containing protein [Luteibaculum oceani]